MGNAIEVYRKITALNAELTKVIMVYQDELERIRAACKHRMERVDTSNPEVYRYECKYCGAKATESPTRYHKNHIKR